MKYHWRDIQKLPDEISLEDLRIVCHISKSTARYYLQLGLIHCKHNGKKTHCYYIKKSDLITALKEYEDNPSKFTIPKEVHAGKKAPKKHFSVTQLSERELESSIAKSFYQNKLKEFPDLIYSDQAAEVTGYTRKTVIRWCSKGHLPYLYKHPKTYIPKKDFLLFLLSETYNKIAKKSETHLWAMKHIHQEFRKGGKNLCKKK